MPLSTTAKQEVVQALNGHFDALEQNAIAQCFDIGADNPKAASPTERGSVKMLPDSGAIAELAETADLIEWLNDLRTAMIAAGVMDFVDR